MIPEKDQKTIPHVAQPILPSSTSDGWHRVVAIICMLGCIGIIITGIHEFFDIITGTSPTRRPIDYLRGVLFIAMGVQGLRFLIRQLRRGETELPPDK